MVQAWYMDESADDPRLPHRGDPCSPVGLEQLRRLGVLYWKVRSAGAGGAVSLPPPPNPALPAHPKLRPVGTAARTGPGEELRMLLQGVRGRAVGGARGTQRALGSGAGV